MNTLVIAPTWLCAASAVAAIDAGLIEGEHLALLVTNNSSTPEVTSSLLEQKAFASIASRFGAVTYLNDLIYPYHPRAYQPKGSQREDLRSRLRQALSLDEGFDIVAQSVHTAPTSMLLDLFRDARVTVLSDGLMSYGPTRFNLKRSLAERLKGLLYLDLMPGVDPVLLSEFGVATWKIPGDAFRGVVHRYAEASGRSFTGKWDAFLLGQYLAALNLLTPEEEESLHLDMVRVAHAKGASSILFKPHPSAPPTTTTRMHQLAEELGVDLEVFQGSDPVEIVLHSSMPKLVVGCFSTGMAMAASFFNAEVVSVGTELVAASLPLLKNSNRIPLALVHGAYERATVDTASSPPAVSFYPPSAAALHELVVELSHRMQPRAHTAERLEGRESLVKTHPTFEVFFQGQESEVAPTPFRRKAVRGIKKVPFGRRFVTFGVRVRRSLRKWYEIVAFRP